MYPDYQFPGWRTAKPQTHVPTLTTDEVILLPGQRLVLVNVSYDNSTEYWTVTARQLEDDG